MSRARDLAALVTPNLFNQNADRTQVGLGTTTIGAKIQVSGAVSATSYYGDGSNLTGIILPPGSDQTVNNLNVTGIATIGEAIVGISSLTDVLITGIATIQGGPVHIASTVYGGDYNNIALSGITTLGGYLSIGGTTGRNGQFIVSNGSGLQWETAPGIRTEVSVVAGAGRTEFDFYHDPNGLDVFINGIKLANSEYSSDGGTKITLTTGTNGGDVVQLVGYGVSIGPNLVFQSLTIRDNGDNRGTVGGVKIVDFLGSDIEVVGTGVSAQVIIPPRKGFVETEVVRKSVSYIDVGAGTTQFSFVGVANTNDSNNTDVYVNGVKLYDQQINYGVPGILYLYLNFATGANDNVEIIGYPYGSRTSIATTTTSGQETYNFSGIGSDLVSKPVDLFYNGIKLTENIDYYTIYGDYVKILQLSTSEVIDSYRYIDNSKVGIVTTTVGYGVSIAYYTKPLYNYDLIVNGVKLTASEINPGISSVANIATDPISGSTIDIVGYASGAKLGISTIVSGAGQTNFTASEDISAANIEVVVNGIRLDASEYNISGVGRTVNIPTPSISGDIVEIFKYASYARSGVTTFSAGLGQTDFTVGIPTAVPSNEVFVNGVRLTSSEFNVLSSGSVIQLTSGTQANDIVTVVGIATTATLTVDSHTGNGTKNIFEIADHQKENSIYINGVKLLRSEYEIYEPFSYTLFNSNLNQNDIYELFEYKSYARVGVTTFVSGLGQTSFTVGVGTAAEDNDVYINGVRLTSTEYSVVGSGNTIILNSGTSLADNVEIVGFASTARSGIITSYTTTSTRNSISVHDASEYVEVYSNGIKILSSEYTKNVLDNAFEVELVFTPFGSGNVIEAIEFNSDNLQYGRVSRTFVAFQNQSLFPISYTEDLVDVYVNGVRLIRNLNYNDSSGTYVIINVPLSAGDIVELVSYDPGLVQDWERNNKGVYTLSNVGIGTTNPRFKTEIGYVGAAGTQLWVNGDARITGILTVGPDSVTIDGINNKIIVGSGTTFEDGVVRVGSAVSLTTTGLSINGLEVINSSGINITGVITATSISGSISTSVTAGTATTALGLSTDASVNTTGIITASSFVGSLTGTATTATTALGFSTTSSINTSGIITASVYYGDGSGLTGIVAASINIRDNGSLVGVATNVNFGDNLSVLSVSGGIATITANTTSYWGATGSGINTTASVGIGTTTFTGTAEQPLQVYGGAHFGTQQSLTAGIGIGYTNPSARLHINAALNNSVGGLFIDSKTRDVSESNVPLLRIDSGIAGGNTVGALWFNSSGKLGIGNSNPTQALSVTGNAFITGIVTATTFIGNLTGTATSAVAALSIIGSPSIEVTNVNATGVITATSFSGANTLKERAIVTGFTTEISNNGIGNTDITGFKSYALLKVGLSTAGWLRIYTNSESRNNDINRSVGEDPTPGSGVIAEVVTTGISTTQIISPFVMGGNHDTPANTTIYISIKNLSGITTSISADLTILQLEA